MCVSGLRKDTDAVFKLNERIVDNYEALKNG
jgi:hypothetical protein